ncbi:MAG: hypothetical protein KDK64_02065, partial [Chlamydiia bacterium]|nr:hypothetical protein [Chlamydiia bacterium]
MKLQIINVVWGEKYINTFLDLSLPTQLSSGNLRELSEKPDYIIYTNESGKEQIKSSRIYQSLEASASVNFKLIKIASGKCPFKILLESHSNAIKEANRKNAPMVFLSPDCILSTGVFTYCEQALIRGTRLIAVCSSRMSLEAYQEVVQEKKANNQEGIVAWSPQELAVTTIKNLHYRAKCLMMSEGNIGGHPSHMYWKL